MRELVIPVELYLQSRILRGELPLQASRVLDLLEGTEPHLTLRRVRVVSSSSRTEVALKLVRVSTAEVMLALPGGPSIRAAPSTLWVPKRRVLVWVRLSHLTVSGTFHLAPECRTLAEELAAGGGRFLAVTEAVISPSYRPNHVAAVHPLALVARGAIEAWAPLTTPTHKHS